MATAGLRDGPASGLAAPDKAQSAEAGPVETRLGYGTYLLTVP